MILLMKPLLEKYFFMKQSSSHKRFSVGIVVKWHTIFITVIFMPYYNYNSHFTEIEFIIIFITVLTYAQVNSYYSYLYMLRLEQIF